MQDTFRNFMLAGYSRRVSQKSWFQYYVLHITFIGERVS